MLPSFSKLDAKCPTKNVFNRKSSAMSGPLGDRSNEQHPASGQNLCFKSVLVHYFQNLKFRLGEGRETQAEHAKIGEGDPPPTSSEQHHYKHFLNHFNLITQVSVSALVFDTDY